MKHDLKSSEQLDWLILDALSIGSQSFYEITDSVQSSLPEVTPIQILERLEQLHETHHIFGCDQYDVPNKPLTFAIGRTPKGRSVWLQNAADLRIASSEMILD